MSMSVSAERLAQIGAMVGATPTITEVAAMAKELEHLRNQLNPKVGQFPPDRQVVVTNLGPAGRIDGQWFKWWPEMASFARMAMKDKVLWWYDEDSQLRYTDGNTASVPQGQTILEA